MLLHFLPQAKWPHVRPDLFDIGQAFFPAAAFPYIFPPQSILSMRRPDRVLLENACQLVRCEPHGEKAAGDAARGKHFKFPAAAKQKERA
jgi:hypothetical protein